MLENKTMILNDTAERVEIGGELLWKLAIDNAMDLALTREVHTEGIDKLNPFGVDSGGCLILNGRQVNECALPSILEAYKMGGKAFKDEKTTDEKLSQVFGVMEHMLKDDAQIIVSDNQIIGIRSERYKLVPLSEILDEIIPSISAYYDEVVRSEVEMSYAETFIKFFTDKKFNFNGRERPLTITLKNSENGEASIGIGAYVGRNVPIMHSMNIVHTKNKATLDELRERVCNLENVISQAFLKVAELETYPVNKPDMAIDELMSKYKYGQKYCDEVKKSVATCPHKLTAADIYDAFAEAMLCDTSCSRETLEGYQNDLLKMIGFDWSKFI